MEEGCDCWNRGPLEILLKHPKVFMRVKERWISLEGYLGAVVLLLNSIIGPFIQQGLLGDPLCLQRLASLLGKQQQTGLGLQKPVILGYLHPGAFLLRRK